ncbi:hypothetical protein QEN19_002036 [Hanseniaspora menglaensis]
MGEGTGAFNPISRLNKHVNNSKSFLQNHLNNKQQQQVQQQQQQIQQQQQHIQQQQQHFQQQQQHVQQQQQHFQQHQQHVQQQQIHNKAVSSPGLNRLSSAFSNTSFSGHPWQQEYQSSRSNSGNIWQKDIYASSSGQQRSSMSLSLESTPGLQQSNSMHSLNNMIQSSSQSRMALTNMMLAKQFQNSENISQPLVNHFSNSQVTNQELQNQWDSEFAKQEEISDKLEKQEAQTVSENQMKNKYEQIWEDLTQYSDLLRRQSDYIFSEDKENPFSQISNPYEVGMEILKQGGKFSEAILCFESAVEQQPQFLEAWLQLGICQTKNEMEWQGITALEKALEIQKTGVTTSSNQINTEEKHIDITAELGTCYINTGMDVMAFKIFEQWIHKHYDRWITDFSAVEEQMNSDALFNGEEVSINKRVLAMFNHVAQKNPLVMKDKPFQVIVGLLNYCIDDYDSSIISFQRALELDTQDEVLWNRLGATLANHSRPEDAVHAYRRALEIKPSFVRGRYNLAISLMNIGWFKESVECLLACLKLQETDSTSDIEKNSNIIDGLNKVFRMMNRPDLITKLNQFKDGKAFIDLFSPEFNY